MGYSVKHERLGIPEPWSSSDIQYNTSKAASGELEGSLIGAIDLNYIDHRGSSTGARKDQQHMEMLDLDIQKDLAGVQERNRLHRAMRNRDFLSSIPHCLN